jgi:hypothetical protein
MLSRASFRPAALAARQRSSAAAMHQRLGRCAQLTHPVIDAASGNALALANG